MMKIHITEHDMDKIANEKNCSIKGIHKFSKFDLRSKKAQRIEMQIQHFIKIGEHKHDILKLLEMLNKFKIREKTYNNRIVLVGRSVFADIIVGNFNGNPRIKYSALGRGSNVTSDNNIILTAETNRKEVNIHQSSNDLAQISTFWGKQEAIGHHFEAGEFIGGANIANSGILFARWNIDENKTNREGMNISSNYIFTQ